MQEAQHEIINIGNVDVPIVKQEDKTFYPVSFMGNRVLLKSLNAPQLNESGYGEHIKEFIVHVPNLNMYHQKTYFIEKDGLVKVLQNSNINRLNLEQKQAMRKVCKYLDVKMSINYLENNLDSYDWRSCENYDFWDSECIESVLNFNKNVSFQKCNKCFQYYPLHECFFKKEGNPKNKKEYRAICHKCLSENLKKDSAKNMHTNKELDYIFRYYGEEIYLLFKDGNIIQVWEWWKLKDIKLYPSIFYNKDKLVGLIKYWLNNNILQISSLSSAEILKITKVNIKDANMNGNDIYKDILGIDLQSKENGGYIHISNLTDANKLLNYYFNINNINNENIFNFDLQTIVRDLRLETFVKKFYNNDKLKLILEYFNHSLPAYNFTSYKLHWTFEENRIRALKFLIEKDMKIKHEKIPLYLTLETMRKHSGTMRNVLRKYYNNNLWQWVNEVYPDVFEENDFNIGVIRHTFDSMEEHMVHDKLKELFKNVIYNQRHTDNTVNLDGMQPDWFVFTDKGVWIIEYFGISVEQNVYNQRVKDYVEKTKRKIDTYKNKIDGYGMIYLYPEDLKNNFKGFFEKVGMIVS